MDLITRKESKEQGLKRYFTGEPCKYGHISERTASCGKCLICHKSTMSAKRESIKKSHEASLSESLKKEWLKLLNSPENIKKRREANRLYKVFIKDKNYYENQRKSVLKYRENNRDKLLERCRELYQLDAESRRLYARQWSKNNINKEKAALRASAYRIKNPLKTFLRCSLVRIEKAIGEGRINRTEVELGYTQKDFTLHIESQFTDGMTWDNRSDWHIDHIKPLSLFIKEGETDPSIMNALSNLKPLWAKDNLEKGASY